MTGDRLGLVKQAAWILSFLSEKFKYDIYWLFHNAFLAYGIYNCITGLIGEKKITNNCWGCMVQYFLLFFLFYVLKTRNISNLMLL